MRNRKALNTALILFSCVALTLVHCKKRKGDPDPKRDPKPVTDEDAVKRAKDSLAIGYAEGDSANSVTEDITLPTTGVNEHGEGAVIITWESSNDDIISTSGVVTGPMTTRSNDMAAMITLTATLTKNAAMGTRIFTLTVLPRIFAWSEVNNSAPWHKRKEHTAMTFSGKMWVIGGNFQDSRMVTRYRNDVWSSGDGVTWAEATSAAGWGARSTHATVVFDGKMWVLGGYDGLTERDVWSSTDGASWTNANASEHWTARNGHAAVVFKEKMWVLGGYDGDNHRDDVWSSTDGSDWTKATNAAGWDARSGHAAVVFDGKMWVLGGFDGDDFRDDVWSSTDGSDWTKATDAPGWDARSGHAAVVFDKKMWVLGGYDGDDYRDDVWWSTNGSDWTKLDNGMPHWSGRWGHTVVTLGEKMFLLGGNEEGNIDKNDVWVYQQTN